MDSIKYKYIFAFADNSFVNICTVHFAVELITQLSISFYRLCKVVSDFDSSERN